MNSVGQNQTILDFAEPRLTPEEHRIWCVIQSRRGKALAITGRQIAERTGITYKAVQEIISHLATSHGFFIASCTEGFFIPATPEEHEKANESLRHRAMVILWRVSKQEKRSIDEVYHQAKLKFEKEA